ncbi:Protein of unknown function- DUF584 [Striga hermonthica]|uniref:Senescence regulator S40 n=1 Tax=Striga hermonthica TaxID=68872 RepID=A0A9N7NNA3_STRHE|nr:Protein of unknown function- DUF584 [Striga hermonthica]
MAASKGYFAGSNYGFLPTDPTIFELDESDVWDSSVGVSLSPELRKSTSRRNPARGGPSSLPMNIPEWSKILKEEYRRWESSSSSSSSSVGLVPPHEFLARNWTASLSVEEGVGRTLKGRDLSRVRNAIWQKTGFLD